MELTWLLPVLSKWLDFVWRVAAEPTLALSGVRKIVADQYFELTWEEMTNSELTYQDLCYTKAKGAQLNRNYWNQEAVDLAVDKLLDRQGKPHSSVSIQLQGGVKDSRSQGYCMQNMVITMTATTCTVDIYYRSTELIQKFLADLVFFNSKLPTVFEKLGREPTTIRFKFANVYLSAVFMPIFLRFEPYPKEFFAHTMDHDQKFYRTCGLATRRFFNETHNYTYRTRVKMFEYYKEHVNHDKMKPLVKMLSTLKGEAPTDEEDDE